MRRTLLQRCLGSLLLLSVWCGSVSRLNGQGLRLEAARTIALIGGEGEATLTLSNASGAPVPLALSAGPVVDAATQTAVSKATAVLTTLAGSSALPAAIAAGERLSVLVKVSGVAKASGAQTALFNGDVPLGTLWMAEQDAPFNVALDGDGTADKPLAYVYRDPGAAGKPVTISLKNADAMSYRVHWVFQIGGQRQGEGDLSVPAGGGARIDLQPTRDVYSPLDRMHPSSKEGVLLLNAVDPAYLAPAFAPPGQTSAQLLPAGLLPARALPVSLRMRRVGERTSSLLAYLYAGLLLFAGGLLSIVASSVLPNMQKKVDLRVQLKALADRTTSVSTRIDSYLRVLLRLERKQIENQIDQVSVWLPAATSPLGQIPASIDRLGKRLAAAEKLDELRRRHELASSTAPPSVTDDMDATLQAAADQLHSLNLTDQDCSAANALLDGVQARLTQLGDTDTLAASIAKSVTAVQKRWNQFPPGYADDLAAALPGVFVVADPSRGYDTATNIVRPMLFAIDHGVAAIHLALDYAMVRASIPSENTLGCTDPGKTARDRLELRHCKLIDLLGTLSWRALREATLLVQQMREDVYEEDIFHELQAGRAEIFFDTQKPRPYLPVFFSIRFKDPRFQGAAAVQRMTSQWSFPDGLCEYNCWKVCHYFSGYERTPAKPCAECSPLPSDAAAKPASGPPLPLPPPKTVWGWWPFGKAPLPPPLTDLQIHASVSGRPTPQDAIAEAPLVGSIQMQRNLPSERTRFVAELLRFSIAFGVALAGLLSGALAQLDKLDFLPATIAIVALGFGADSIKNLLTQTPGKGPA